MIRRALIGHTGFVGSNLVSQIEIDQTFNSRNIREIEGQSFDEVICAGISAAKWVANNDPGSDRLHIKRLADSLKLISTKRFVLISTIDVYKDPNGLTEHDVPSSVNLHPYGRHRLEFERFISDLFETYTIIRLPALFGTGLKKNALFDLINNNLTNKIVPNASYQWYPLRRLGSDLKIILQSNVSVINIVSEPISMETIRCHFFPISQIGAPVLLPPKYDLRTNYASMLGGKNGYHLDAPSVLNELNYFINPSIRNSGTLLGV